MRLLPALILVLGLVACGGDDSSEGPVTPPPAPTPAKPPPEPKPDPRPPSSFKVPEGNLRGDAAKGASLYALYCATCHGQTGAGDGVMAATLNPKPANHSDKVYMGTLTDADIYKVIHQGGAAVGKSTVMAPWGAVINDQGIRDLIAHIRSLAGG